MAVGQVVDERKVGHREDVVHHLGIALKGLHEVLSDSGHVRHTVQQPRGPVLAIYVIGLVGYTAEVLQAGEILRFAQVPLLGEDELEALRYRGIEVFGVGVELVPLVHRTPVFVGIALLAGSVGGVRLRGGVAIPSFGMDDYLVGGVRAYWSGHGRKVSYCRYKCTYNI